MTDRSPGEVSDYSFETIPFNSGQRSGRSEDLAFKAELVGELALTQEPASLANKILLAPTSPFDNLIVRDTSGQYTLLVDREKFSFGGDECNRIGTSYEAFNNQPAAGDRPVHSCLDNQIADLHEQDTERMRNG